MRLIGTELIDELTAFLDRQSEHLEKMLLYLDALRESLIRRDPVVLQEMQDQLLQEAQVREELDGVLRDLREKIGRQMGCSAQEVCLSRIRRSVGMPAEEALRSRQRQLAEQVVRLQRQHLATELLVRECARLNRRFLEVLTGRQEKGTIYDSRGRSAWGSQTGLMSVKL
jgi:flagellar biosynthesis/type III secretory pathway chaperone